MLKNEKVFDSEKLDKGIAMMALKLGWADNRLQYVARVLKVMLNNHAVHDKEMRQKIKDVIKFLEEYDLE